MMFAASKSLAIGSLACLAGIVATAPATAHHSTAMFDMSKTTELTGVVRTFEWTNPHAWLWVVVPQPKNTQTQAGIEFPALAMLRRGGMERTTFKTGDKVTVKIHPLKDGRLGGLFVEANVGGKIVRAD